MSLPFAPICRAAPKSSASRVAVDGEHEAAAGEPLGGRDPRLPRLRRRVRLGLGSCPRRRLRRQGRIRRRRGGGIGAVDRLGFDAGDDDRGAGGEAGDGARQPHAEPFAAAVDRHARTARGPAMDAAAVTAVDAVHDQAAHRAVVADAPVRRARSPGDALCGDEAVEQRDALGGRGRAGARSPPARGAPRSRARRRSPSPAAPRRRARSHARRRARTRDRRPRGPPPRHRRPRPRAPAPGPGRPGRAAAPPPRSLRARAYAGAFRAV